MPTTREGTGTVLFRVTSTMLIPAHDETPVWTPDNPTPEPVPVPDKAQVTLSPVPDPESEATISGTITILTEVLDAFTVGDEYIMTIAQFTQG